MKLSRQLPLISCVIHRFGKTEEEFANVEEYNDYIEKREDLSKCLTDKCLPDKGEHVFGAYAGS
jgi:hypothetical protein